MGRFKYNDGKLERTDGNGNSHNSWEEDNMNNNHHEDATVSQEADQFSRIEQESDELIWIKDSCNVEVDTTDTQAAVSLQVALQLAIALVIRIFLGDSEEGDAVAQEMQQSFDNEQTNRQKIYVDNSKDVYIKTTDTDLSVNIQALLQVLVTLVAKVDIG